MFIIWKLDTNDFTFVCQEFTFVLMLLWNVYNLLPDNKLWLCGTFVIFSVVTAVTQCSHLCHKVCGCVAERFQHGCGLGVEQRHPVGHLVVYFTLNIQLSVQKHTSRMKWRCQRRGVHYLQIWFYIQLITSTGLQMLLEQFNRYSTFNAFEHGRHFLYD